MSEVSEFIASYKSADELRIRFEWNGKHGEEFSDHNLEFREKVRDAVLDNVSAAPLELVRDLFRADTQCSREAFGIAYGVFELAENLLRRGGGLYLDDFWEGKYQSFDAEMGSAFEMDRQLAESLLAIVRQRLQSNPDSSKAELWRLGDRLFLEYVEKSGS